MPVLYVMQGPPGSGKSTIAKAIQEYFGVVHIKICSTDDYFVEDGIYIFRPEKLGEFHAKNLAAAKMHMDAGKSVIVDNTNIQAWQCKPYVEYATKLGISVQFIRVTGAFQSIHGVPQAAIDRMKASMENLTIETVMASKSPF